MHARAARTAVSRPADAREREAERVAERVPLRGAQPLPFFEESLGHDFSRVRIHDDAEAHALARSYDARAFTYGSDIYFGRGELAQPDAARLMAHELAHITQPDVATTVMRQAAPPTRPLMPTIEQRDQLMPIYNPEGGSPGRLSMPGAFRANMVARVGAVIDQLLVNARSRQTSTVDLQRADVQALGTIAWREITARFGPYLRGSAAMTMTPTAVQAELNRRVHLVSDAPAAERPRIACNLVVNLMDSRGDDLIDQHNVVASTHEAKNRGCSGRPLPAQRPPDQRDQDLFESVRDEILRARNADLLLIAEFGPSFSEGEQSWIQTRLIQSGSEPADDTIRRGRWITLGTILHELLHTVTHPLFRAAFGGVERTDVGIEGFAEFFAREVYDDLRNRAATDPTLRMSIETRGTSFEPRFAPDRNNYPTHMRFVQDIRAILNNDENLRAAFFSGRTDYLGLGNWGLPPNLFGVGVYMTGDSEHGFVRAHYARVVFGQTGRFQLHAGADATYFSQGDRIGLGPDFSLQYSWPNFYISAGLGAQVTASAAGQPFGQTVRLDLLPHVDAGVRFSIFRVGIGSAVLIPTAGAPGTDRTSRFMLGLGAGVEF